MRHHVVLLLVLAACGHSEPFVTADQEIRGPFAAGEPLRLTYSPLTDVGIGVSADGAWLTYQYERGTPDRDRCVAVLPAGGGQRQAELCPWGLQHAGEANSLSSAALRADGMVAFTMHTGLVGNMTSNAAALYLASPDSVAGAIEVLRLLERPPGASTTWSDLVDPIWVSNDELLVLAARRHLVNLNECTPPECPIPPGKPLNMPRDRDRTEPRDTLMFGVEFARIRVGEAAATVSSIAPVEDAIGWSHDPSRGSIHYIVQRSHPDDHERYHESVADTLMVMSLAGGPATSLYGTTDAGSNQRLERLHGVASGHGRVFVSRSWRTPANAPLPVVPRQTALESDIVEVMPDGALRVIAPAVTWHWNRLRMSPDGQYLYAEGLERGGGNLYRITLP